MQENTVGLLSELANQDYCYLTTTGRITGHPHEIEIWFTAQGSRIYLMAGDHGSDWVRNLRKDPNVTVRIAKETFTGQAAPVKDTREEMNARYLMAEKYQEWEEGRTLSNWAQLALVVGIDLQQAGSDVRK